MSASQRVRRGFQRLGWSLALLTKSLRSRELSWLPFRFECCAKFVGSAHHARSFFSQETVGCAGLSSAISSMSSSSTSPR